MAKIECLICFESLSLSPNPDGSRADDGQSHEDDFEGKNCRNLHERNRDKFLFHSFCRGFDIKLPTGNLKWDFRVERMPFCSGCRSKVENLVRLRHKLDRITKQVNEAENSVRAEIKTSRGKYSVSTPGDQRVRTVRDFIVGPVVRIKRISHKIPSNIPALDDAIATEIKVEPTSDEEPEEADHYTDFIELDDLQQASSSESLKGNFKKSLRNIYVRKTPQRKKRPSAKRRSEKKSGNSKLIHTSPSARSWKEGKSSLIGEEVVCSVDPNTFSNDDGEPREAEMGSNTIFENHHSSPPHAADPCEFEDDSGCGRRLNPPRRSKTRKKLLGTFFVDSDDADEKDDICEEFMDDRSSQNEDDGGKSSESDNFEDDARDKDFILPDDTLDELNRDNKLSKRVQSALSKRNKDKPAKTKQPAPTLKKIDEGRFSYGDFEFCGNPEVGYMCSICNHRIFRKKSRITNHIRVMHMGWETSVCPTCGKICSSSNLLKSHMFTHLEKTVICEFCGKAFSDQKPLQAHIAFVHQTKYTEICEICGKKFKTKNFLTKHIRQVHNREKNCYCEVCGKGFFSMNALKAHTLSHTDEKRFECKYCGQKLHRSSALWRHVKQFHSNVSKDDLISSSTATDAISNPSLEETDSEKASLKCKYCGIQYNRQNNLTRHMLQIHHINVKGLAWKSRPYIKSQNSSSIGHYNAGKALSALQSQLSIDDLMSNNVSYRPIIDPGTYREPPVIYMAPPEPSLLDNQQPESSMITLPTDLSYPARQGY